MISATKKEKYSDLVKGLENSGYVGRGRIKKLRDDLSNIGYDVSTVAVKKWFDGVNYPSQEAALKIKTIIDSKSIIKSDSDGNHEFVVPMYMFDNLEHQVITTTCRVKKVDIAVKVNRETKFFIKDSFLYFKRVSSNDIYSNSIVIFKNIDLNSMLIGIYDGFQIKVDGSTSYSISNTNIMYICEYIS